MAINSPGGGGGGVTVGTSFPGSPSTGDRYIRSDLDYMEFFYNGTRWLSTQLMQIYFQEWNAISVDVSKYAALPQYGVHDIWIETMDAHRYQNAAGRWDIVLNTVNAANTFTPIYTQSGSGAAVTTWESAHETVGLVVSGGTVKFLGLQLDEISGSALFYGSAVFNYRIIAV